MSDREDSSSSAELLFADWLSRGSDHAQDDLEFVCRDHPEKAEELRALRTQWAKINSILHGGPSNPTADVRAELLQRLIGFGEPSTRYRIEGEIGRGSMGAVLHVHDENLRRPLAMKVALGAHGSAEGNGKDLSARELARFLEEAEVTGRLDHPGIVPVHELGLDAEGRVYFTMKLVEGKTLKQVFDELVHGTGGWTQTRVLGIVLKVCEAMSYAHAKGVLHRDLKPANVMVGRYGEVYVMDWGLAKLLGRRDEKDIRIREARSGHSGRAKATADSPLVTVDGDIVGTPAYMSPEQAAGRVSEVGPHSDVYSVGALLYHLLAGHMPYVRVGETASSREVWRSVKEGPPRALDREARAPPELVAISERAMARERSRRYADMAGLAEDLRAYLEHRVVGAYRTGAWAGLKKWVERNKALAATAAASILALVVGAAFYVSGIARAQAETTEALVLRRALALGSASDEVLENDGVLALLLAREAVRVRQTPETLSRLHQAVGSVRERGSLRHTAGFVDAVFSPNGDQVLGVSMGVALLWDPEAGEVKRLQGREPEWLTSASFSPSGDYILTSSLDRTAHLWAIDDLDEPLAIFEHEKTVWTAAFSRGERYVLTASNDGTAKIWDRDHPEEPVDLLGHTDRVRAASFSPQGDHVLTISVDGIGRLWKFDAENGTVGDVVELVGHEGPITAASFSPAGDRIVTSSGMGIFSAPGDSDDTARVWGLSGEQLAVIRCDTGYIEWAGFSPSGSEVLTTSFDGKGRLWDLQGRLVEVYPAHPIWRGAFSPDGKLVALGCADGSSRLFGVAGNEIGVLGGHEDQVMSIRFSPDGRSIVTASLDKTLRIWSVFDERIPTFHGHLGQVQRAVFSPDGSKVATASWDRTARLWEVQGNEPPVVMHHRQTVFSVEFSPDGQRLVTASGDGTARIWDLAGNELKVLRHGRDDVRHASFSPAGDRVATICWSGPVSLWDTGGDEDEPVQRFEKIGGTHVAFDPSPDSEHLLIANYNIAVRILDTRDGSTRSLGYTGEYAMFSASGDRILVACKDGSAVLLDRTDEMLSEFSGHEAQLCWASFSSSGDRIVTASRDGTAKIWNVDGRLESTLRGHANIVRSAVFSPDDDFVLTASSDGTARTWLASTEALIEHADRLAVRDFSGDELSRFEGLLVWPATGAQALMEELFDTLVLKERIVSHLREDRSLHEDLRRTALCLAEELIDSPRTLNIRAWDIVKNAGGTTEEYARALRFAQAACDLQPNDTGLLNTLGQAQYRAGRCERAIETLNEADRLNQPEVYSRTDNLLFIAMAHQKLGDATRARSFLRQSRELLEGVEDADSLGFLREAEALIGADR